MAAMKSAQTPDNEIVVVLAPNRDRRWTPFMLGSTIIAFEIAALLLTAMGTTLIHHDSPLLLRPVVPIILVAIPTLLMLNRFMGFFPWA